MGMMGAMLMAGCSQSNQIQSQDDFDYTVEQFADLQLLRYKVHGFDELPLEQKKLVYYLSEAALVGICCSCSSAPPVPACLPDAPAVPLR